jgi:aspartate ammonia-lyase
MLQTRLEQDLLGPREVPEEARYGIHTLRALENFPLSGRPVHPELLKAFGAVKLAALRVNRDLGYLADAPACHAMERACRELMDGQRLSDLPADALQGGAGTNTNLGVNEVLANRALELLGRPRGDYAAVSPTEHLNLHQSTANHLRTNFSVWIFVACVKKSETKPGFKNL